MVVLAFVYMPMEAMELELMQLEVVLGFQVEDQVQEEKLILVDV
jgi:hypothetical protein